jgi:two-component system sensor histidine kinase SenX3
LIQEIIEITRLQSDAAVMDAAPVELRHVVAEAIEATSTAAQSRGISVTVEHGPDATVLGNEDLLVMAVKNLVDNAIQYSDPGKAVKITTEVDDEVVALGVVDQGIGIPQSEVDRIFERFYRVDPARSRETGGTGLGLSIVKHIATRHDGAVEVWSKLGVGSTFTLKLPVSHPQVEET